MFNKIISVIAIVLSCSAIGYAGYKSSSGKPTTAFIKPETLFSEFKLTKELKGKFESIAAARKSILDSLLLDLKYSYSDKSLASDKYAAKEKYYLNRKELYEAQNRELTENYDQQIWERLKQYVKEYGSQANYEYILGFRDDGMVMYAQDSHDITSEVVAFINKKYEGNE